MPARMPIALLAALISLAIFCASALAEEVREVGCGELGSAVTSAGAEPETIVLDGMCTKADVGELGVGIKSGADLTLRGAPGTVSGIDGTGVDDPVIDAVGGGTLAFEDLTFENATRYTALQLRGVGRVTIAHDAFLDNAASVEQWGAGLTVLTSGAGCPGPGEGPAITVRSSTFDGNTLSYSGEAALGAGAFLADACPSAGVTLEGNTFEDNTLRAEGAENVAGAGLFVGVEGPGSPPLAQHGNVFAGNRAELLVGADSYNGGSFGGGGEGVAGLSLTSVRDRFTANSVPASTGANASGGAGLALGAGGNAQNYPCGPGAPATAVLEDDVLAGNAISGAAPPGAAGAALRLGCRENEGDQLTLLDSTVTANSSPAGGVAGIAGQLGETLTVANSIVDGDTGGAELSGFTGPVDTSYSDLCAPGSSAPIAGTGNICAAPRLAGPPGDVHETAGSPTREAGSNALVPAGLATDFYGAPRIAGGTIQATCAEGDVQLAGPVVDMGAAELSEPLIHPLHVLCPPPFRRSSFTFPSVSLRTGGVLLLTFRGLTKGTLLARAAIPETETVVVAVHGKRTRVRRNVTVPYGGANRVGALPSVLQVRIRPSRKALRTLRRHRRLNVSLTITYAANRLFPATQSHTIHVRWIAPLRRG